MRTPDQGLSSAHPLFWWLSAGVILAIAAWVFRDALSAGWWLDDYNQRAGYWGSFGQTLGPWDMHRGIRTGEAVGWRDTGFLPWWTHDDFRFAPLRPLTSVLLFWNFSTFGVDATPYHAVTFGLWAVMALVVTGFYRRLLGPVPALLALAFFVLCRGHSGTLTWVASRGLVISALFGFGALWAYVHWRESGRRWAGVAHGLALAFSLAGGEYGLCIPPYLAAYELLRSQDPLWRRARCLAPATALTLGYLAWHVVGGYGVSHGRWYANPLSAPAVFAGMLVETVPSYLTEGLLALPVPLGVTQHWGWGLTSLLAVVSLASFAPAKGHARWLWVGGVLACIPCSLTLFQPRLVVFPKLGFAAAIAVVLCEVWRERRGLWRAGVWLPLGLAVALAILHGPYAGWQARRHVQGRVLEQRAHRDAALNADLGPEDSPPQAVFILNASVVPVVLTASMARHVASKPMIPWQVVSPARGPQMLRRLTARSFELTTLSAGILANPDALAFRSSGFAFQGGEEVRNGPMRVRVLDVAADSGPTHMAFEFESNLESPRYRFLFSTPGGYRPFSMPAVGESRMVGPAFNVDWLCPERPPGGRPCI